MMVSRASAATVTSVAMIALAIALLIIGLHQPVLNLLFGSASPEVLESARVYLIGSSTSFIGIAIVQAVCGALRGIGKTRASLALSLIMNLLYVLLNIVFITLLNMGVMGMTLAINIARFAGAACALYYLFRVDATLHIRLRDLFHFRYPCCAKLCLSGFRLQPNRCF